MEEERGEEIDEIKCWEEKLKQKNLKLSVKSNMEWVT